MLPDSPSVHPELPWSVGAEILEVLAERVRADQALALVCSGGIAVVELKALLQAATINAPFLGISMFASREGRGASSHRTEEETVVDFSFLTNPPTDLLDHQEHLRSRFVAQLKRVVLRDGGEVVSPDGLRTLARAETRVDQVNLDQAGLPSGLVLTLVRVRFLTDLDRLSQEVLE